LNYTRMPC